MEKVLATTDDLQEYEENLCSLLSLIGDCTASDHTGAATGLWPWRLKTRQAGSLTHSEIGSASSHDWGVSFHSLEICVITGKIEINNNNLSRPS